MRFTPLLLLPLVLAAPAPVSAATWLVRPDGTGDVPTIQDAVDSATDGDFIELAGGTFVGPGNRDVGFQGKELVIRSASDDPLAVVIDVQGGPGDNNRAFVLDDGEGPGAGFRSLTITGGHMVGGSAERGGAVHCSNGAQPFFEHVRFVENVATHAGAIWIGSDAGGSFEDCEFLLNRSVGSAVTGFGGAVYLSGSGSGSFTRCRFIGNESDENGAALLHSGPGPISFFDCDFEDNVSDGAGGAVGLHGGPAVVADCRFLRNENTSSGWGGAVDAEELLMTGCTFVENRAGTGGGAVAIHSDPAEITGCTFVGNSARRGGGLAAYSGGEVTVRGCHFEANESVGGGNPTNNGGGAIYLESIRPAVIRGSSFIGNAAANKGGAVYSGPHSIDMRGCTLAANSSPNGSGIWIGGSASTSVIRRTIIAFGLGSEAVRCDPGAAAVIECSDLFGNAGGPGSCFVDGGGNFSADPLFCWAEGGDYRLQWGSPCLPASSGGCDVVGRYGYGACNSISINPESWGSIKARYRE